jgi:outer membrane protein assembly factor BamB
MRRDRGHGAVKIIKGVYGLNKKVLMSFLFIGLIWAFVGCAQASAPAVIQPGSTDVAVNTPATGNQATSGTEISQTPKGELPKIGRVGDILANPSEFKDQEVIVEGKIITECPSGCWFTLDDGTGTVYVDLNPSNLVIPQKRGAEAKVYGKVVIENGDAYIIGTKVEF